MSEYCQKCELCHESGLTDAEYCPWYGEPCGCNHPNRGILETDDKLLDAIHEVARLRGTMTSVVAACEFAQETGGDNTDIRAIKELAENALKGGNEARVFCKHDPTRKCVDCEICADDKERGAK